MNTDFHVDVGQEDESQKHSQGRGLHVQSPRTVPTEMRGLPVTPRPNDAYYRSISKVTGMTYIPKSMTRHKQPTLVDALIACATLLLLCLCFLLLLSYLGM